MIIGFVFLITMFISGNYIFNINKEKIKIEKANQYIKDSEALITKAKENQKKKVQLQLEIDEKRTNLLKIEIFPENPSKIEYF